jgi:hypothetical protein
MEVYDGNNWVPLNFSYSTIGLSSEAEMLLDWARLKCVEEIEISELSKTNEAVCIAHENLKKAKAQLKATILLSKEHETKKYIDI